MPRSSRHKSHKQQKRSSRDERNYSDEEEEESVREVKVREEPVGKSGAKVSRDSDSSEKRKAKDLVGPGNGDYSSEHGVSKRRKDAAEPAVGSDRWDGREAVRAESSFGDKEMKSNSLFVDSEKTSKSKVSGDSKSRSSRRQQSGGDRKEDGLGLPVVADERKKDISRVGVDRKAEKDSSRKESNEHKDVREKERGGDWDKKVQDGRRSERLVDGATSGGNEPTWKKGAYAGEGSRDLRREVENSERQTPDSACNVRVGSELEKQVRKKAFSDNKDSEDDEVANVDNGKHFSSREDRLRHGKYKGEGNKDDSYKEMSCEEYERDIRYKYEKQQDQQSLRERSSDRSEGRQLRDESRPSESNYKKAKLQDSDYEDSAVDDRDIRYRDSRGRKRFPDDGEDYNDVKSRSTKEPSSVIDRKTSSGSKLDSPSDRKRSESRDRLLDSVDSSPNSSRQKRSPSSSTHVGKDQNRHGSKREEPPYTELLPEERQQRSSSRDVSDQISEPQSIDNSKREDDKYLRKFSTEDIASLQWSRSPKTMEQVSPVALVDKSPSSSSGDRRYSNQASLRRSLDIEEVGQSGGYKVAKEYSANEDRAQDIYLEKVSDDRSQDRTRREPTPAGSSFTRTSVIPGSSYSTLHPRQFPGGGDSGSAMGSSEDDFRNQTGERKLNNSYKRSGESGNMVVRAQGSNSWKGIPNWRSPGTNGFVPFQHGLGPAGFHPVVPQFPASLFGVRPSMDLNHGVAWHDPSRPFGWQNAPDETCAPLLHGWDGNNGLFGDETHIYRRPDWEQSRRMLSNKGWELNSEALRGHNGNTNVDILTPKKEIDYSSHATVDKSWGAGQSDQQAMNEMSHLERPPGESIDVKPSLAISTVERTSATSLSNDFKEKKPEISNEDGARMLGYYLSRVDISMDLACPELYKQCMNVIGTGESTSVSRTIKEVELEDGRAFLRNPYYNLQKLLFPSSTESIFEKSMALYKKQKEEMKVKTSTSSDPISEPEKLSLTIDVEVVLPGDPLDTVKQDKHVGVESDVTLVPESELQELSKTCDKEVPWPTGESIEQAVGASELPSGEGNADFLDDPSAVVKGSECEISSSEIASSEVCVAVMPELIECRVNLSRIHHSPESTH